MENTVTEQTQADEAVAAEKELENLKVKAATLGITHHPNIGAVKLREKINEAMKEPIPEEPQRPVAAAVAKETKQQKMARKRLEAGKLIRIRVTCRNPAKSEWSGEIFTAGNSTVGSFKKYVPFDNDAGWHVPQIIYNMMQERKCQIFVNKSGKDKGKGKEGKMIKEFAIEVMDPLTGEELKELATQQAIAQTID